MSEEVDHVRNIRELLGRLIGQKLMDITQKDPDEEGDQYTEFLFEKGNTVKFYLADGDAYACGFPMCFSDPNDAEDDELYHPSPENAAAKKWAAVSEITPNGEVMHVIPCFGKLHHIGEICDCKPRKEFRDDGSWFFAHEEY